MKEHTLPVFFWSQIEFKAFGDREKKKSVDLVSEQEWLVIHLDVSDKNTEVFFPRINC